MTLANLGWLPLVRLKQMHPRLPDRLPPPRGPRSSSSCLRIAPPCRSRWIWWQPITLLILHAIRVEKELVGPPLVIGHGSKFLANTTRNVGAASKKPRRINDGRCERISLLAQAPLGQAVVVGVCTQRKGEVGSGSRDALGGVVDLLVAVAALHTPPSLGSAVRRR